MRLDMRRTAPALPGGPSRSPELIPTPGWYVSARRGVEVTAALGLALVVLPWVLLAALLVKLTSRGPAFYLQRRVGRGGVPFTIYKLRTMRHNCESATGPRWALPGDPRVTLLGRLLRRTHLDELPQLLNVLRGDMSLIGPRPERPEFVARFEQILPGYGERLRVRPGVTGLAQVQVGPGLGLEVVRRKLAYDLYYIRHLGPWLEVRILAGTVLHVLGLPLGLVRVVCALPARAAVLVETTVRQKQAA
jgi:lipopolysaccharide/colanic/teichoic acid biosynthesis glycosyltransferase